AALARAADAFALVHRCRHLDLDDLRAPVGELANCRRAGADAGEIEDGEVRESGRRWHEISLAWRRCRVADRAPEVPRRCRDSVAPDVDDDRRTGVDASAGGAANVPERKKAPGCVDPARRRDLADGLAVDDKRFATPQARIARV